MHVIRTHFLGPTNHRGSRFVARCHTARAVVSANYSNEDQHLRAVLALAAKMGWSTDAKDWQGADLPGDNGGRVYFTGAR